MTMTERATVIGVFASRELAEQAIEELHRQGFGYSDIGFITRDQDGTITNTAQGENDATDRIAAGATGGGVVGGILGAAVSVLVPGLGLLTTAGVIAATLTGLLAGSVAGGLIGALTSMGVPEEEARFYEGEVAAGRVLVTVNATGRQQEAREVLRRLGALDTESRSPFDPNNPANSSNAGVGPLAGHPDQANYTHQTTTPNYQSQTSYTPTEERREEFGRPLNAQPGTTATSGHDTNAQYTAANRGTETPHQPMDADMYRQRETMGSEVHTDTPTQPSYQQMGTQPAYDPNRPLDPTARPVAEQTYDPNSPNYRPENARSQQGYPQNQDHAPANAQQAYTQQQNYPPTNAAQQHDDPDLQRRRNEQQQRHDERDQQRNRNERDYQ